jgi:superfamily II DNA or RNA helicase
MRREGYPNPFEMRDEIALCSYHFAAAKAEEISHVPWDLVVVDEAHRLRNVYKPTNKMAKSIRESTAHAPKLLLTATPLQNSLLELYGLASVIDEHIFGELPSFRERFIRDSGTENGELKERLKTLCTRTLRKQVLEYIRFTRRVPITQEFVPTPEEELLYEEVSEYLRCEVLLALPSGQRTLMTLVLRKLLASSTFAIAGTLRGLIRRLEGLEPRLESIEEDFEALDEIEEEWEVENGGELWADPTLLREELAMLRRYADLAEGIRNNAKGEAVLVALNKAFEKARDLGAAEKAVIFTESRRTQQYLYELLCDDGYAGRIVLFNGTNTDQRSREIYEAWREKNRGREVISGSRSADTRAALIEEFRERADILIATESAAEGVNLQFCSLVVNYDLPWNPQRVEQRIGRCHRYGQKHDVVVVNFLNKKNEADQRVFELLSDKFKLFSGVFGASDEVLGAVESGVDIEKRIAQVYQECRRGEEIQEAFDELQAELESEISDRMAETRQALLDNFDEDVLARLKVHENKASQNLSEHTRQLLILLRTELADQATFEPDSPRFRYHGSDAPAGTYHVDWREAEKNGDTFLRQDHPLTRKVIQRAADRPLSPAHLRLDYSRHPTIISGIKPLVGTSGWLEVAKLSVESLELEEYLVLAARTDAGDALDEDLCRKLLSLDAVVDGELPEKPPPALRGMVEEQVRGRLAEVEERNGRFFDEEVTKLDRWSDDLKLALERELKELDKEIKEGRRSAKGATSLQEKLAAQKALKKAEARRTQKRRELYDAQDAIDMRRDELIENIERQLGQSDKLETLFSVRWSVV